MVNCGCLNSDEDKKDEDADYADRLPLEALCRCKRKFYDLEQLSQPSGECSLHRLLTYRGTAIEGPRRRLNNLLRLRISTER